MPSAKDVPPFPISFGPASAPLALAIRRRLRHLAADPGALDAVQPDKGSSSSGGGGGGSSSSGSSNGAGGDGGSAAWDGAFTALEASANARAATHSHVANAVDTWVARASALTGEPAGDVVAGALARGVPALGMRCGSRVVCARASKKWVKAGRAIRGKFSTVGEFADVMESIVFDAIPRAMALRGDGATAKAASSAIKRHGVVATPDGPVALLVSRRAGEVLVVKPTDRDATAAAHDAVDVRDVLELPRYAAMYVCRETSPPTFLEDYMSVLTGWTYNDAEEDVLAALHFGPFETELATLTAEREAAAAAGKPENELLRVQIDILNQYLEHHRPHMERFRARKWAVVEVGGAGRASAEVARDLSKMHRGALATRAIDHRRSVADVFEAGDSARLKRAFSNFVKELTKDWAHLPTFADAEVASHYRAVRDEIARRGADGFTADNIGRILRANGAAADGASGEAAAAADEPRLTVSPHFVLAFGPRGSGDVVYGDPNCYKGEHPYAPGTMDDMLMQQLAPLLERDRQ